MNKAQAEGEAMGLSTAELAFYEALGTNDAAVMVMGDEVLKQIARELTGSIRKNATVDWSKRSAVQAKNAGDDPASAAQISLSAGQGRSSREDDHRAGGAVVRG